MKTANYKLFVGAMTVVAGSLLASSFVRPLCAQVFESYKGKFTLTQETRWGSDLLPAGSYTLSIDGTTKLIRIRDAKTQKLVAFEVGSVNPGPNAGRSEIHIALRGSEQAVSAVELGQLGEVYSSANPFPKAPRNTEEAKVTEGVPVEVAQE